MSHDGTVELAKQLTLEAIRAGADVVKYQLHFAESETLTNTIYFTKETRFDYFERTAFSNEQFKELAKICHDNVAFASISVFP